ncbi:hypothetical protein DPMN_091263 [Dreissena polymorpha]|uniref:Uncharacterized protein n=1 Tax=Dreissena polymorpha TaxID=45954 RepID=A0A9D4R0J9_DREPO|nr:hypothetical protein DPMN_091263 [Dreissena polymorpha]
MQTRAAMGWPYEGNGSVPVFSTLNVLRNAFWNSGKRLVTLRSTINTAQRARSGKRYTGICTL